MGKTYNPFKMWGSWIGLAATIVSVKGSFINIEIWRIIRWLSPLFIIVRDCDGIGCELAMIMGLLLYPIMGFLIGWVIHILIRRTKKI